MNETHLFLDLDGTLISNTEHPKPRPHLRPFLEFCFSNFDHVYLWTAALPEWFLKNQRFFKGFEFRGIYTRRDCDLRGEWLVKPFHRIWKKHPKMDPRKCILIDDCLESFRDTPENGILIPTYEGEEEDEGLLRMIDRLREWLIQI